MPAYRDDQEVKESLSTREFVSVMEAQGWTIDSVDSEDGPEAYVISAHKDGLLESDSDAWGVVLKEAVSGCVVCLAALRLVKLFNERHYHQIMINQG